MSGVRAPLLVVGDALLDRDVTGTADRLAPDAPVPVVAERGRRVRPGGAALAARLAADDGRDVTLVTGVGDDPASEELCRLLDGRVRVIGLPLTGALPEKTRVLAQGRPVVRVDRGEGRVREATDEARRAVRSAPAVLVADYGRGAADALRDVLAARPPMVWDPHPRGGPPVAGTRLVTPARSEARAFADDGRGDAGTPTSGLRDAARAAAALVGRWEAASVAVTMGAGGALLSYGEHPLFIPAPAAHHGDACGAGDRFAATAAGLLADGALVGTAVEGAVTAASGFVAGGGAGAVTAANGYVAGGGAGAVTAASGFAAGGRAGAETSTSGYVAGGRAEADTPTNGYIAGDRAEADTPTNGYIAGDRAGTDTSTNGYIAERQAGTDTPTSGHIAGGQAGADTPTSGHIAGGQAGTDTPTSGHIAGDRAEADTPTNGHIAGDRAGTDTSTNGYIAERQAGTDTPTSGHIAGGQAGTDTPTSGHIAGGQAGTDTSTSGHIAGGQAGADTPTSGYAAGGRAGADTSAAHGAHARHRPRGPAVRGGVEAACDGVARDEVTPDGAAPEPRAVLARVRAAGGAVVAAGGCFDLLHAGHVRLLQSARRIGDCLIVCVNSDASVRRRKGKGRPVNPLADRARVLLALGCVDAVAVFDEDTPERLLAGLRPDVWVKGGDYSGADLPEATLLEEWGGQAVLLPYLDGRSSTSLIARAARDGAARSGDAVPGASGGGSAGGVGAATARARDVGGPDAPAAGAGDTAAPATGAGATDTRATDVGAADDRATDAGAADDRATDAGAADDRATEAGVAVMRASDALTTDAGAADARTAAAGIAAAPAAGAGATDARTTDAGASAARAAEPQATRAAGTGVPQAGARVPRGRGAVERAPVDRDVQGTAAEWGR